MYYYRLPENYVISFQSYFKKTWDLIVLIIAIYNSFVVPYMFAFYSKHDLEKLSIEDIIIDSIFVIDIILMFMTSFMTKRG